MTQLGIQLNPHTKPLGLPFPGAGVEGVGERWSLEGNKSLWQNMTYWQFWGDGASEQEHGAVKRIHQCGHMAPCVLHFLLWLGQDVRKSPFHPTARGKEGKDLEGWAQCHGTLAWEV